MTMLKAGMVFCPRSDAPLYSTSNLTCVILRAEEDVLVFLDGGDVLLWRRAWAHSNKNDWLQVEAWEQLYKIV
jgi:hypothetical protein